MFIDLEPVFNVPGNIEEFDYCFILDDDGGESPYSGITAKGSIANKSGIVTLEAKLHFKYSACCDRCCEFTEKNMVLPVFHTLIRHFEGDSDSLSDDCIEVEDFRFDLDSLLREDVLLNEPPVFLCDEDCMGLCPICGANLNYEDCDCEEPIDPRLEIFTDLLKKSKDENN